MLKDVTAVRVFLYWGSFFFRIDYPVWGLCYWLWFVAVWFAWDTWFIFEDRRVPSGSVVGRTDIPGVFYLGDGFRSTVFFRY